MTHRARYALSGILVIAGLLLGLCPSDGHAAASREQLIPILGVTIEERHIVGTVANVIIGFEERTDQHGLAIVFRSSPGRFSRMAQTAIEQAIYRTARAAALVPDSWTITLSVPYSGVTIYGESLSAMVALSVMALAKGDSIQPDRVMTGAIRPDGKIAPVGSVSLKVTAANEAHMRRVLVPDELDLADGDWATPFLVQVSPVRSVTEAYLALTDRPLRGVNPSLIP
ncbi:MAG TPA: S16 family serine protease [Nitrospirales bacterium]|nr:S16 family serine protease [Nitrospirales bacterium]